MPQVTIPTAGQLHSNVGSSYWFAVPTELQAAADEVVEAVSQDKERSAAVRNLCYSILLEEEEYTDSLYIMVGGRRYALYRRDGQYRFGAHGEHTSAPYDNDQQHLIYWLSTVEPAQ